MSAGRDRGRDGRKGATGGEDRRAGGTEAATAPGPAPEAAGSLADLISTEEEALLTCVHCGFCLPECPTYTRLGDENDSPRGRLYLMRAVVEGRLDPGSDAFQTHIDRCLGCRACEPVCPSGVPYGRLLELARSEAAAARRPPRIVRLLLAVFGSAGASRVALALGRLLRATRLPDLIARYLPGRPGKIRTGLAMLAASEPGAWMRQVDSGRRVRAVDGAAAAPAAGADRGEHRVEAGPRVALLRGCVQAGLFAPVNRATERVLRANGVSPVAADGQGCCGALHAHGGDLEHARNLARRNVEAFEAAGAERVVVNAAGCGAAMKGYGHLLAGDPGFARRAERLAARVQDVTEVLAERGPRRGAPLRLRAALDDPCHLLHAQGVSAAPRRVLEAVPGLELTELEDASGCCGGAGIYGITHPELGGRIGSDKVAAVLRSGAEVVATGNPGCIMQIGGGLRLAGSRVPVLHPVELLDASYRRAGYYEPASATSGGPGREEE